MSTVPKARTVASTSSAGTPGSVMSAAWVATSAPAARRLASASARDSARREEIITRTPSAASASAVARPSPREPATTSATRPSMPRSTGGPYPSTTTRL